ncbi:DUF2332 domain-containing protein [Microbacterium sp. ZXX196]|uniref:DUF2332 domain-containing protein n=1 Tax=Microbacterium sp. ZXX196 TaxID=2609291 RepID=UPI0012B987FF|nr:DUF2332 domain-containing protein [Microbacterium sp. ZXX196]MTE23424.1 DUF2332 family protein [Microbacterium sp. ZXX196]
MDPALADVLQRYDRFAREEAPGRSARYAEWAAGLAADPETAAILAPLPAPHRQPPVVFAVTRMLGAPADYDAWAAFVRAHADRIVAECAARTTQTNEPLRCAPLAFALARIPGRVALLEVGASAGLCLFPDRYAYRFVEPGGGARLLGSGPVVLTSELRGGLAAPERIPEIVWRAGIDPQPRDARRGEDRAWIEGLVWPGEDERARRIAGALDIAAANPPEILAADAAEEGVLASLAARAPADATLVVTTPGVLPHLPRPARERLISQIRDLDARWITIDHPRLHDAWTAPIDAEAWPGFVLALDGAPIAATDPLGGWIAPA